VLGDVEPMGNGLADGDGRFGVLVHVDLALELGSNHSASS
jgi:hypothetical protein